MGNQETSSSTAENANNTLLDKIFRDKDGNIVIAQKPNLPILVGLAATLLKLFLPTSGNILTSLDLLAFGALFTWGWMEAFNGVNYFRRSLGLMMLVGIVANRLQW